MNKDKIASAISKLKEQVCDEGKKALDELAEGLGVKTVSAKPMLYLGMRVKIRTNNYKVICASAKNLNTIYLFASDQPEIGNTWNGYFRSLKELSESAKWEKV